MGGCPKQCEPPVSDAESSVVEPRLSTFLSGPSRVRIALLVSNGPYRVPKIAISARSAARREQPGLEVTEIDGPDTGLPGAGVLGADAAVAAACRLAPDSPDPVLVVIEVSSTDNPKGIYGWSDVCDRSRRVAIACLYGDAALANGVGSVTREVIEALTLVHEAGYAFGMSARDDHRSAVDHLHCSDARCVMCSGARANQCAIPANLLTGPPLGFCPDYSEELAELQRRRLSDMSRRQAAISTAGRQPGGLARWSPPGQLGERAVEPLTGRDLQ
jgi:hypothetical protein